MADAKSPAFFRVVKTSMSIHLSPQYLDNIEGGVEEQLNRLLMEYVEDLGGVVLAYAETKIKQDLGYIAHLSATVQFRVQVKFLVFAPKVGEEMVGTVNVVGFDHIGLLVHGVFNVSLAHQGRQPGIPNDWKYQSNMNAWKTGTGQLVTLGAKVNFKVLGTNCSHAFFSITGSALSASVANEAVKENETEEEAKERISAYIASMKNLSKKKQKELRKKMEKEYREAAASRSTESNEMPSLETHAEAETSAVTPGAEGEEEIPQPTKKKSKKAAKGMSKKELKRQQKAAKKRAREEDGEPDETPAKKKKKVKQEK